MNEEKKKKKKTAIRKKKKDELNPTHRKDFESLIEKASRYNPKEQKTSD